MAQNGGRPNFLPAVIRAGVQRACVKLGPALKGPIRYFKKRERVLIY